MLSFSGSLKVFVAVEACDMRKGFNGLHALVTQRLGEDPRQGAFCAVMCQPRRLANTYQSSPTSSPWSLLRQEVRQSAKVR